MLTTMLGAPFQIRIEIQIKCESSRSIGKSTGVAHTFWNMHQIQIRKSTAQCTRRSGDCGNSLFRHRLDTLECEIYDVFFFRFRRGKILSFARAFAVSRCMSYECMTNNSKLMWIVHAQALFCEIVFFWLHRRGGGDGMMATMLMKEAFSATISVVFTVHRCGSAGVELLTNIQINVHFRSNVRTLIQCSCL